VLGHELAHVVTGEFGAGPLRIAGIFGGLLPDPGRIEGFAEAASPRESSEGTLHQWTAAMRRLELLPPLQSLFQLSFLQASAARSYSASGSFVDYVHEKYGPVVLRQWYGGGDLPNLARRSFAEMETDWHAFLDGIEVPADVMEIARPRFSRPGVFERRCPHAVDRALSAAGSYCPVQEEKARGYAETAIKLDPTKLDVELSMARCAWYASDPARAQKQLTSLAADEKRFEPGARRAALEFSADIAWQQGKTEEAKLGYEKAAALTFRQDDARQLDVKLWALSQPATVQTPLRVLLAPKYQEEVLPQVAVANWAVHGPHQDVARYLLARLATRDSAHRQEGEFLDELDVEKLPLASLQREAHRMKLLHACQTRMRGGKAESFKEELASYKKLDLSLAEKREAERVVERCEIVGLRRAKTSKSLSP
jgi:hypothetical protein